MNRPPDIPRNEDDWAWWVLTNPHSRTQKELKQACYWAHRRILEADVREDAHKMTRLYAWTFAVGLAVWMLGSVIHVWLEHT